MDVSIIIVNYNTKLLSVNCINSIRKFSTGFTYEIILVDNASVDGSKAFFKEYEGIKFIENIGNEGFGHANNLGVKHASGSYIFLLNSDTILIENSIKKMLDFYSFNEEKLKIGALGCSLISENEELINSGNFFPEAITYIKSYFRMPITIFKINPLQEFQKIDFVTGADLFISKLKYNNVNGFDEDFFLYYEETDLQKRLTYQGFQQYLLNTTRIIHLEGGSDMGSTKISNFKRMTIAKSRNRYLKKHSKIYFLYILFEFSASIFRLFDKKYSRKENLENFITTLKTF